MCYLSNLCHFQLRTKAVVFSECSWHIPGFGQWEVVACALPVVNLFGLLVFWVRCLAGKSQSDKLNQRKKIWFKLKSFSECKNLLVNILGAGKAFFSLGSSLLSQWLHR